MGKCLILKGSSDPSHFIFEKNVGKSRIRHRTTLNLNNEFLGRLKIDRKFKFRVVIWRIRHFPTLISNIKWLESELPLIFLNVIRFYRVQEIFQNSNFKFGISAWLQKRFLIFIWTDRSQKSLFQQIFVGFLESVKSDNTKKDFTRFLIKIIFWQSALQIFIYRYKNINSHNNNPVMRVVCLLDQRFGWQIMIPQCPMMMKNDCTTVMSYGLITHD